MKTVVEYKLEDVNAGIKLGENVKDARGNTLLPAGTVLTSTTIERLSRHGIETLPVYSLSTLSSNERAEMCAVIEKRTEQRFKQVSDVRLMQVLAKTLVKYHTSKLSS